MENGLYLVGTFHLDVDGPKRLEKLLNILSPKTIALELNEELKDFIFSRENREELEKRLDRELRIRDLSFTPEQRRVYLEGEEMLDIIGYEAEVARLYAASNSETEITYVDCLREKDIPKTLDPSVSNRSSPEEIRETNEVFLSAVSGGLDHYLNGPRFAISQAYSQHRNLIPILKQELSFFLKMSKESRYDSLWSDESGQEVRMRLQRDDYIADRIKEDYRDGNKKLVAINGLSHLAGLDLRLSDLNPRIVFLDEVDNL